MLKGEGRPFELLHFWISSSSLGMRLALHSLMMEFNSADLRVVGTRPSAMSSANRRWATRPAEISSSSCLVRRSRFGSVMISSVVRMS